MWMIVWDWAGFVVRWVHVITGIAWIGSSFYFIAVDLGLRPPKKPEPGVGGETWQVHGGGFYHLQKYLVAPDNLPDELTWFKWESYSTWLSGFALLCILYYAGAELFLIDPEVLDISPTMAIAIGLVGLAAGWIFYDLICRSALGNNDNALFVVLFVFVTAMAFAFTQVFSGRGAMIHTGALIATIMTANVFFIIIPNQKKVVADLRAGRTPPAELGRQAKQRSLHNNYLTLPVIFLMLSAHAPEVFATQFNWVIASLVLLMGAFIRHFFNSMHAGHGRPWWTWLAAALLLVLMIWLSSFSGYQDDEEVAEIETGQYAQLAASPYFEDARDIVINNCSMCHANEPLWPGMLHPPKGVVLDNDLDIIRHGRGIIRQSVNSKAMPPGVMPDLYPEDRALLLAWISGAEREQADQ